MLNIEIKSIPHNKQRYETVGDYWTEGGKERVRVSRMDNWKYEFLVIMHELIEDYLCKARKISEAKITAFDKKFEKERQKKIDALTKDNTVSDLRKILEAEPGHDPKAPYVKEHKFAEKIERMLAKELEVGWSEYDKTVMEL